MHYCILVITKEFPTNDVLGDAMRPFDEDTYYRKESLGMEVEHPAFLCDYWLVGGRYGGSITIDVSGENFDKYNLRFYEKNGNRRTDCLFRSAALEGGSRADLSFGSVRPDEIAMLQYMGLKDNVIYADAARICDIKNEIVSWAVVLPSGEAMVRKRWTGERFIEDEQYDEKAAAAIRENSDCWISVVDAHD